MRVKSRTIKYIADFGCGAFVSGRWWSGGGELWLWGVLCVVGGWCVYNIDE